MRGTNCLRFRLKERRQPDAAVPQLGPVRQVKLVFRQACPEESLAEVFLAHDQIQHVVGIADARERDRDPAQPKLLVNSSIAVIDPLPQSGGQARGAEQVAVDDFSGCIR